MDTRTSTDSRHRFIIVERGQYLTVVRMERYLTRRRPRKARSHSEDPHRSGDVSRAQGCEGRLRSRGQEGELESGFGEEAALS